MFCRTCDNQLMDGAVACTKCGMSPWAGNQYCPQCGASTQPNAAVCLSCGSAVRGYAPLTVPRGDRLAAGLCAIFLGSFGVHKFILGYQKEGINTLLITFVGGLFTCGIAWGIMHTIGIIEGIIYLTKSDAEFQQTYVVNRKGWF